MEATPITRTAEDEKTLTAQFAERADLRKLYHNRSPYYMALFSRGGHRMRTATAERVAEAHGTTLDALREDGLVETPEDTFWVVDVVSVLGY